MRPSLPPSDRLELSVRFTRLNSLAGLLDRGQDCIIIEGLHGRDIGGLIFERDIALFDACSESGLAEGCFVMVTIRETYGLL